MDEYRFTFGFKYAEEPHPNCSWVTPEGWLSVIAIDEDTAVQVANAVVGRSEPDGPYAYAFVYSPEEWQGPRRSGKTWDEAYPAGCLLEIRIEPKTKALTAEAAMSEVHEIMWPKDDPEKEWSPDTLDAIADVLRVYEEGRP